MRLLDALDRFENDDALDEYLDACEAYYRRQLVVYRNWPQHEYGPLGYTGEKRFVDRNA